MTELRYTYGQVQAMKDAHAAELAHMKKTCADRIYGLEAELDQAVSFIELHKTTIAELEAALRPFAHFADAYGFHDLPDDIPLTQGTKFGRHHVTAGDCKRARTLLARMNWIAKGCPDKPPRTGKAVTTLGSMGGGDD
jgi:hypothetical protein